MTGKEIIKELLLLRKWSQTKLAEEIGKSQTNITGYLNRGKNEMRLDVFVEMVEAMGCEVVVQDKMGSKSKWKVKYDDESPIETSARKPTKQETESKNQIDLDKLLADGEPIVKNGRIKLL